jgi:hypothetical protein
MKLYHGTTEAVARAAFEHGLSPREDSGVESNWDCVSRSDMVYLSRGYAPYFAACCTEGDERWGLVEVDTDLMDEPLLHPDEDFLEQATRTDASTGCPLDLSMEERTAWYRERLLEFQPLWDMSVKHLGNCCYLGQIVPAEITRVAIFEPSSNATMAMLAVDPMISLMNWKFMGETKYSALTDWFFGMGVQPGHFDPVFFAKMPRGVEAFEAMLAPRRKALEEAIANREGLEILERKVLSV